jgi:hypothetical protein
MGRFKTRTTDFTIEDVNDWLAGSAEAETKVWIDCQFLFAMQKMALKKVVKNFYGKSCPKFKKCIKTPFMYFDSSCW